MFDWQRFVQDEIDRGATPVPSATHPLVACYGDARAEFRALRNGPALVDRSYRRHIELTGADRGAWLHNLTSNEVKNLSPGEGNYAFALNVKGRILFDLGVIVRQDSIWIDLDASFLDSALAHFEKYKIVEDVVIENQTPGSTRFGLAGESAKEMLSELGAAHAATMPRFSSTQIVVDGLSVPMFRSDFTGQFAVELMIPADNAVALWKKLRDHSGAVNVTPVGHDAVQRRRIEAGIPWAGCEISNEYLPAETGQYDRSVSRLKGCYLGQEIVERMHSRGAVARRLVGLRFEGGGIPQTPAPLTSESGTALGQVTSACRVPWTSKAVGLGYVKSASAEPGTRLQVGGMEGLLSTVVELPFAACFDD